MYPRTKCRLWVPRAAASCSSRVPERWGLLVPSDSPLICLLAFAVITAAVAKSTAWLNLHVWVFVLFINN